MSKYIDVFKSGLGTLKGYKATLEVKPNSTPKFYKPRSVPYALRMSIEHELDRLEEMGVVEKVNRSEWATPIVPVPKSDGSSIRLCGDFKVTVNPSLLVDQYPLRKPEDMFALLSTGEKFTKLDLSQAYQQVPLEEESKQLVTVTTHKGLYRYTRLPFGIASAPAIFQHLMEKILQNLRGVTCYLDDILVTGHNDEEHLTNWRDMG